MTAFSIAFFIVVFLFGLVIGSFLNVCIYRMPLEDKSVVNPPHSACPKCGSPIRWYDNVPLLSFALLGGKCRNCRQAISWRYPAIELLTGVLTVCFVSKNIPLWWWTAGVLIAVYMLLVLSIIDLDLLIIPDELSLGMIGVGLAFAAVNPNFSGGFWHRIMESAIGGAAGFGLFMFIAVAGEWIFKKEAMGGGDIKLMAGAGTLIGAQGVVSSLMLGSAAGSVYGIALLLRKKAARGDPIPFGPFLSIGILINLYQLIPLSAYLWGQ
ncbi:MAG: prepilin peptidase [Elusimicrobiaceae bacterium]|nr:prepilin peptidase [Elusimicrobiaceae bacterium]